MQRLVAIMSFAFLAILIIFFVTRGSSPNDSTPTSQDESTAAAQEILPTAETQTAGLPEVTNSTDPIQTDSPTFEPEVLISDHVASTNSHSAIPSAPPSSANHTTTNDRSCPLSINRSATAIDVSRREPVGVSSVFSANNVPVYVFMEIDNSDGPQRELTVRWNHLESDHVFEQTIPAGVSPTWRTWVYHIVRPEFTGRWHVEILAPGSCPVAELYFEAV